MHAFVASLHGKRSRGQVENLDLPSQGSPLASEQSWQSCDIERVGSNQRVGESEVLVPGQRMMLA